MLDTPALIPKKTEALAHESNDKRPHAPRGHIANSGHPEERVTLALRLP